MAQITSYTTLQSEITNWLNRLDVAGDAPTFIQLAEASLRRDPRVRRHRESTLSFDAGVTSVTLPAEYREVISLWRTGLHAGEMDQVEPGVLESYANVSDGIPRVFAVIDRTLRIAPAPLETVALAFNYWETIPRLGSGTQTNWLLDDHPDIYLYACLLETAPFIRDDPRLSVWAQLRNDRISELFMDSERSRHSGSLERRVTRVIGG